MMSSSSETIRQRATGILRSTFDFGSISSRQIPSQVSYTIQNLISLATIAAYSTSFFITLFALLPLVCLHALLSLDTVTLGGVVRSPQGIATGKNGKVDVE